jgi:hypothetical protein
MPSRQNTRQRARQLLSNMDRTMQMLEADHNAFAEAFVVYKSRNKNAAVKFEAKVKALKTVLTESLTTCKDAVGKLKSQGL